MIDYYEATKHFGYSFENEHFFRGGKRDFKNAGKIPKYCNIFIRTIPIPNSFCMKIWQHSRIFPESLESRLPPRFFSFLHISHMKIWFYYLIIIVVIAIAIIQCQCHHHYRHHHNHCCRSSKIFSYCVFIFFGRSIRLDLLFVNLRKTFCIWQIKIHLKDTNWIWNRNRNRNRSRRG